jgi:hypothetical protein
MARRSDHVGGGRVPPRHAADTRTGPYCTVPQCADTAVGAVELAYAHPIRRSLCARHMRGIRELLAVLLHEPALAPFVDT